MGSPGLILDAGFVDETPPGRSRRVMRHI